MPSGGRVIHGYARAGKVTPEYHAWAHVVYNHRSDVVGRWRRSFEDFIADMGPRPVAPLGRRCTLQRIDPERPWGPQNAQWALSPGTPDYDSY